MRRLNQGTSVRKPKRNSKVYQSLLLKNTSWERQWRRELQHGMFTLVVLKKRFLGWVCLLICLLFESVEGKDTQPRRSCHPHLTHFHKAAHKLVRCYWNTPCSKIHFSEQLVQFHQKGDCFRCRINFAFPSTCSSSSTWQAITYASAFFPLQCIFLLLSYRTFNSDTNTFSTSYAQILSIPFTNCAGGRQVLPLWRQNLGEENTRSCKGMGKVGTKALFAHATWMKWTTTKIDVSVGRHLNWIHTITIVSILARWIECLWWI